MRIRTRRIRPYHKKVKPILWIKVGVKGLVPQDVPLFVNKVIGQFDVDNLVKEGYITFFTPTREQDNVTMEIL